jgi:hypothetical protein
VGEPAGSAASPLPEYRVISILETPEQNVSDRRMHV